MDGSHYFLKALGLESYMGHDPLPRVDMESLVYPSMPTIPEPKMKDEDHPKSSDPIKDVLCDRQDGIAEEMSPMAANVQADDFFSSLELQSSSKTSSNMLSLSFSNKSAGGIITRSRFSSSTLQETGKAPGEKTANKPKAKGRPRKDRRRKGSERAGRRVKAKGKGKKLQSGKKLSADGRERISISADAKRQNYNKLEENVLEKSLALEKSNDDDWGLFNNLGSKKEIDEKMFENKPIPTDLQNPVRRCTPELFSMSSILMSDGLSEGKVDVDNLLEAEDFHDSFLEEMEEFTYAPPRSHTGGKWKPGSLSIRTSPMLWDNFLDERHQDEGKTPSDSPTEFLDRGEKLNKFSTTKWKSFAPPAVHATGKWKPLTPPASYTGGKWKPSEFPQRLKKSDQELLSPDDTYEADRETDVSPAQVGGKWKPGPELWKPDSSNLELDVTPPTRGKWGSTPGKSSVNRSTLDVLANSQSTSGKCLKTSGGMIQYYCSPCNRRLSCKKMYRKHVQSELHFKRVLQENELEFDSRSLKLFHGLFTQAGCRGRGLGKRLIKRPEIYRDAEIKTSKRDKKASGAMKLKGKRVARRELVHCEVCRVKVPSHLWGKHLVSYCHSRRFKPSDPEQQKLILDNIHAIVKQAPYQCGICKFYCNTHTSFKKHWTLSVHKEMEQSKNKRFWCALCSFESEMSRSMELHLDSNSHREVLLAVNKSIPIIIRHKVIFNCDICFKEFRFNRELIRHKEIFHEKADSDKRNKFVCPICRHSCKSIKSLQRHALKSHKDDMKIPYFCTTCNEFFSTAEEAKLHRNGHPHKFKSLSGKAEGSDKDSPSRSCSYCQETFENLTKLKNHLLERHAEFLPKCFRCGMVFALSQEVSRHIKSNECAFARESPRLSSPTAFACENCAFGTNSKSEFLLHSALHQKKDKDEKKISCPICGSLFTQTSLSIHLRTHLKERTYECSACSKAFVRKDRYMSHLKLKHGASAGSIVKKKEDKDEEQAEKDDGKVQEEEKATSEEAPEEKRAEEKLPDRRQSCGDPKCRYVAKDLNDWENHCLFHIGPKKYQCPECFYSTKTNTVIKRHYLIHFDERSFPCHLCSFKARLKSHLKRHMRLHTGAKPYKCPYCPYTCNILENLRKHVLHTKLHPGKKMYECKLCGFDTNVAIDFKRHLTKCHKGDSRLGEADEVAGIYSREEDSRGLSSPLPVKPRASTSQTKKAHSDSFLTKVNLLTQRNSRIAPKPSFNLKKSEPPSLNFKSTGNLVEDKRQILKMELEKLKNQIKPSRANSPRSYPSPAEKDLKMRTEKALEKNSDVAGNILSPVTTPSVAEETSSKATGSNDSTLPQMEFSSVCILYENALPSEEIELNLLENYQV